MAYIVYYMVNHDYLYMVTPEVFGFNQHTLKEEGACDKGMFIHHYKGNIIQLNE